MNSLNPEMAIMSAAAGAVEFAINWLVQSTLLIIAGLLLARYLQRKGAAVQSLIYRTTLVAVLLCPIATWGLGRIGVSGWSITLASAYQMTRIDPTQSNVTAYASSTSESLPTVKAESDVEINSMASAVDGGNSIIEPPPSANLTSESTARQAIHESSSAIETSTTAASEWILFEVYWLGLASPFVLLAWVLVSGCLLARLASSWLKMSKLVREAECADASTTQLCHRLANELSVSTPDVMISPFISSPCLAGIGLAKHACILLPDDDLNLPMRDVLVHELAHLRRLDCHWNLARQVTTAIYWFQPLMWMLSRRIEIAAEEVCDDIVVSNGANRHDYAHRLVDIAELSADVSAAAVAAAGVGIVSLRSILARRVERILDTSRSLSTRVGHLLMIAVITVGMAGTLTVGLVGVPKQKAIAGETAQSGNAETQAVSQSKEDEAQQGKMLVVVTLPDGSVSASTHVAVVGYDLEKGEMKLFIESMTDAQGHCQIDDNILPTDSNPQNVRFLIARRDGYGIGWKLLGGPSILPLDGLSTIDVKLHEEGIVEGKLIDVEGQPAANESLQIEAVINPAAALERMFESGVGFRSKPDVKRPAAWVPSVTTDASGRFKLTGLPKDHGIYMSLVNSKRFAPQDIAINTGEPEQRGPRDGTYRALVKNTKPGEEAVIALGSAKVFTGTITYEDSGEPVPGAKISIWASQQEFGSMMSVEGVTDAEGKYRVLPNPGIRFGVSAYPPSGVPYMARQTERITWENSELTREVNIKVPRVSLVRGRVLEEGSDKPVEGATITFEAGVQSGMPANVVTGWQAQQTTDANGNFTFAVPHGRGTLLVKKKDANYILQHKLSREIQSGKPGGSRVYAHALHEVNTSKENDSIEVEIRIKPGHEVSGKIVDEQGKPINNAVLATNLDVWDYTGEWRGVSGPTLGGTFRLKGLTADQEHPVYFLDPRNKLGAMVNLRASKEPMSVVLKPCGSAKAKFILDRVDRQFSPVLYFVLTPGEMKYDFDAMKAGKTLADSDFVANLDRINYGNPQEVQEGIDRYHTFPALIPGATYRLLIGGRIDGPYKDFTVQSGETLDLGEFTPKFDE